MPSGNSWGSEIWHKISIGLIFGPGIFLRVEFCPDFIIPDSWNAEILVYQNNDQSGGHVGGPKNNYGDVGSHFLCKNISFVPINCV